MGEFGVPEKFRLDFEKSRLDFEKSRLDFEKSRLDFEKSRLDFGDVIASFPNDRQEYLPATGNTLLMEGGGIATEVERDKKESP